MADQDVLAEGLPSAPGPAQAGESDQPSGDPETPDSEAKRSAAAQQSGKQNAQQQQQAFDTMRSRRAFVAGLMAQGGNPQTALTQSSLGSNLS